MPIQSEQKKIMIILKIFSVKKRNWCSYYVINSYMYSSIVSYAVPIENYCYIELAPLS